MNHSWSDVADDIESGDPDLVNTAVEAIKDMEIGERIELFEEYLDGVADLYATSEDGYVRQSCIRAADALGPGMAAAVTVQDGQSTSGDDAKIREQTDSLCGFFLEAMTDEDGRVRQSAQRGLQNVCRTYDALDDQETVQALAVELEEMASKYTDERQRHLLNASEDAKFILNSGIGRYLQEFDGQPN